ncbi:hypothetical protein CFC21_062819 [Triticum aestivum]|uniref:Uncharacterized protein n=2 Tax=Triticum aestivum TaxID=4565 RepID=A0A3B6JP01_WHEAT|nr:hypothetical protein CFC21_062819 [Triticum aestivum]
MTESRARKLPAVFVARVATFAIAFRVNRGAGAPSPRRATGMYIDRKCPFTGTVLSEAELMLEHATMYEKRHPSISPHISPFFRVKEGDHVIIGQCRPLSKTVRFNLLKVIPPVSTGGTGKKTFTAA